MASKRIPSGFRWNVFIGRAKDVGESILAILFSTSEPQPRQPSEPSSSSPPLPSSEPPLPSSEPPPSSSPSFEWPEEDAVEYDSFTPGISPKFCRLILVFIIFTYFFQRSEAVTSLASPVNEKNFTAEVALLGGAVEDSVLVPDPLPSVTLSGRRRSSSVESSSFTATMGASYTNSGLSSVETPHRSSLRAEGILPRLHSTRSDNFKDDMEVFSPLVNVQPITPSLDKLWKDPDGSKNDQAVEHKASFSFPNRKFTFPEVGSNAHPIFYWKPSAAAKQDDNHSTIPGFTTDVASRSDDSSLPLTLPEEAWGGERLSEKLALYRQNGSLPARFYMLTSASTSTSVLAGLQDPSPANQSSMNYSTSPSLFSANSRAKDTSSGQEMSLGFSGHVPFGSLSMNIGSQSGTSQPNLESTGPSSWNVCRKLSTYAERISTSAAYTDGVSASLGSPKIKKIGVETREEQWNSLLSRLDASSPSEVGLSSSENVVKEFSPEVACY